MVERPIKKSERPAKSEVAAPVTDSNSTDREPRAERRDEGGREGGRGGREGGRGGREGGRGGRGKREDDAPKAPANPALMRGPKPQKPKPEPEPVVEAETAEDAIAPDAEAPAETTEG